MKIGMYMYDKEINLNDESTALFLQQYEAAKESMKDLLDKFEEEDTRIAMFYIMSLRCFMDDFLEFCTDGINVAEMEYLLNNSLNELDFDDFDDDEGELLVEFDDDDEEE